MAAVLAEVRESTLRLVTSGLHEETTRELMTVETAGQLAARWVSVSGPDGQEHLELRWQEQRPGLRLL